MTERTLESLVHLEDKNLYYKCKNDTLKALCLKNYDTLFSVKKYRHVLSILVTQEASIPKQQTQVLSALHRLVKISLKMLIRPYMKMITIGMTQC